VKAGVSELLFSTSDDFRTWLSENGTTSGGVWLVFGKSKEVVSLSAREALEEALCFGWIDGQMESIDDTKYRKYFARRREKSVWSEKNKTIIELLREQKRITEWGEKAVECAMKNGNWNQAKPMSITNEQVEDFAEKLKGISPAYENFNRMSASIRSTYTKRYLSFKKEESRQRDFAKIVERLNKNLKPM
jgi:uncharacterized protein YdeI (YjbR/CyaY-like superfamily)